MDYRIDLPNSNYWETTAIHISYVILVGIMHQIYVEFIQVSNIGLNTYLRDPWNMLDILSMCLSAFYLLLDLMLDWGDIDVRAQQICGAIAMAAMFFKLFRLIRFSSYEIAIIVNITI